MTQYDADTAASVTATAQKILIPMIRQVFPKLIAQQILGVQPMSSAAGKLFTMKYAVISKSKYKFSRANWYVADVDAKYYWEIDEWCTQHFGKHPDQHDAWSRWVHLYEDKIHFRDEKDYVWFMLRWS